MMNRSHEHGRPPETKPDSTKVGWVVAKNTTTLRKKFSSLARLVSYRDQYCCLEMVNVYPIIGSRPQTLFKSSENLNIDLLTDIL
jgi:hypothetical protein